MDGGTPVPAAGDKVQITGTRQSGRGQGAGYVACGVNFSLPALAGGTEKLIHQALPAVGVPGHLGTDPVSVYIQVSPHSIASSPYLQSLTHKPYIKETY